MSYRIQVVGLDEPIACAEDQSVLEATGELDRAFVALQKALGLGWSQL